MTQKAFQDYYPDDLSHCYGCGSLNEKGLQIKSFWDGEESVCTYTPETTTPPFPDLFTVDSLPRSSTATPPALRRRQNTARRDGKWAPIRRFGL